jgi:hypothetical protein
MHSSYRFSLRLKCVHVCWKKCVQARTEDGRRVVVDEAQGWVVKGNHNKRWRHRLHRHICEIVLAYNESRTLVFFAHSSLPRIHNKQNVWQSTM